nr:hypothetical protein [Tanacetum cinerariifolium]
MSDSDESGVTYMDISSPFEELSDIGSSRADDHEHLMLPEMLEDPYVEVALQAPPSPDYVSSPEHADDEIVAEDQPYAKNASPIAQSPEYSPEYVPESDFEAHPEDDDDEEPEEDPVDYLADGGDDGDDEEESSEDDEMDVEADEEEEDHPAPADSVVVAPTAADQAPSAEETEPFETDESAATPPPHPTYRTIARISIPAPGRGLQVSLDIDDSHVTLTPVHSDGQQGSSSMSSFVTSLLILIIDPVNFSEFMRTNQSPEAVSNIPGIVYQYMHQEMTEAIREAVQIQTNRLQDFLQRENYEFLRTIEENMKKIIKEQPRKPPTPDRDWKKTLPAVQGNAQSWISALVKQTDAPSSFNKLLDTPIDFSNFIMNRLSEVYKATTDQLDWDNPEGQQYPHNLLQPLSLIPDNRGRRVIPFAHFINNDLEHLRGDLVPRTMWIQKPLNYDKHALWGVSHWAGKRQQFYGFTINRESAFDVYSKRRIIVVTDLKIVEWHNHKHLDWISLSNLTVEERFAFNVSLRMFTRSIVIQRRVEDLQRGVESYQKRLNLTKPDTYRSNLKRCEAYTAYSNPIGFIYHNKDKKNRLMRIDELYKFSDGTLNDVRNALDDRLKGIRM